MRLGIKGLVEGEKGAGTLAAVSSHLELGHGMNIFDLEEKHAFPLMLRNTFNTIKHD